MRTDIRGPYARVDLGITLMCTINNGAFNIVSKDLWLDIYFAGCFLSQTRTWMVPKGTSYDGLPRIFMQDTMLMQLNSKTLAHELT
jgi:hypothetical protein